MRRKTFTAFLLDLIIDVPAISPSPLRRRFNIASIRPQIGVASNANPTYPAYLLSRSLRSHYQRQRQLVERKSSHVGDHVGDVVRRQGALEGGHVTALAIGWTALGDDACDIAVIEQFRVTLLGERADVGHEVLAAAAAVATVAARAVALIHGLTALGVAGRRRRDGHQSDGGAEPDAPSTICQAVCAAHASSFSRDPHRVCRIGFMLSPSTAGWRCDVIRPQCATI